MFWDTTDFCMKLLKAECEVNQQDGGEEFKCYMIWRMMMAMLHSNGQLRIDRDWDTEKGCQKPDLLQKTTDDDDDDMGFVYVTTAQTHILTENNVIGTSDS